MAVATQNDALFRFEPKDQELVHFLESKKERSPINYRHRIVERNLYGDNPWEILAEGDPWNDSTNPKKKVIFVFTELSKARNSENRISRVAGCGTWDGKAVPMDVKNENGQIIGKKRAFTFKPKKGFELEIKDKGHWMMHEISIDGYNNVVSRITKDFSEKKKKGTIGLESHVKRELAKEDSPSGKKLCTNMEMDTSDADILGTFEQLATIEQLLSVDDQNVDPSPFPELEMYTKIYQDYEGTLWSS